MLQTGDMIEAIKRRASVRSYIDRPVEQATKNRINDFLGDHNQGPFGHRVRFSLIDLSDMEQAESRQLGTYGFIKGARLYIAGVVKDLPGAMEDFGYCLEQVIVRVTDLGLGTCWLGGTFKRASFARKLSVTEQEVIPAISPVGYASDRRTVRERIMRRFISADQRKPWTTLFFQGDMNKPLAKDEAGDYVTALECVRLAPSATNYQPWRIVKEDNVNVFHFLLKRKPGYGKLLRAADLQLIDMGIAMSHFELAARQTGLDGDWKRSHFDPDGNGAEYLISWIER